MIVCRRVLTFISWKAFFFFLLPKINVVVIIYTVLTMPRKTKFSALWLEKKTESGELIGSWCQDCKDDQYSAYCKVCDKRFSISNMGFSQLVSHSKCHKHQIRIRSAANQSTFSVIAKDNIESSTSSTSAPLLQLTIKNKLWIPSSLSDKTLKAEALLLLTAVKSNYSFASIGELGTIMASAFEDSDIAKNIKLSDAKARYMVKFGLAPYFRQKIFSDLFQSSSFFTLYFDETSTKQVKKQMDIYISYWSEKYEKVVAFYCDSFFLGHANAETILEKILQFVSENGLNLKKLLQCSMDGPNVNLSFQKKLNSHLAAQNIENLIDVGTCCLHVMHNALKKGISELNCNIESFVLDIFQWFKMSAARREDFHRIQESLLVESAANHLFQRHVENRWLTLGPVCERVIEQYEALKEYFLKTSAKTGEKHGKISGFLKNPQSLIYLHFVVFLSNSFMPYLTLFQKETPLIHILFYKQNELLRNIMFKFIKHEAIEQKEGLTLSNINCQDCNNWIALKNIDVGSAAKKLLCFPEHKDFLHNIRSTYIKICEFLQKKLPLSNPLLRDLQCIAPECQNESNSKAAISRITRQMIKVTKTDTFCDDVNAEYSMYMYEDVEKEKVAYFKDSDICKYWAEVSKKKDPSGSQKYPNLTKLIKSCLTLSHGNSIPERGFSVNNNIVTEERSSLSEIGIKSLRICKDYLKNHENVSSVSITKELIHCMQKARSEYACYLDQVKVEKQKAAIKRKTEEEEEEMIQRKRAKEDLREKLAKLTVKENDLLKEQEAFHILLSDANEKLQTAIKKSDFNSVKVGQMMLNTANDNLKKINEQLGVLKQDICEINKKLTKF